MKLKKFQYTVAFLYIVSSLAAAFIACGIYLLCVDLIDLSRLFSLFVASLAWLYMLMFFAIRIMGATLRPVNSMYEALEHVSAGPTSAAPPDPESYGISKEIVEQVVKDVYDLSSGNHENQEQLDAEREYYQSVLALQSSGIVTLDRNRQIAFANKQAKEYMPHSVEDPVGMTLEDVFGLEFSSGKSLSQFLTDAQADKIQDRMLWERVRVGKSEDTVRYFDMIADYNKNESHGIETIVVLLDKTESYHGDDEQVGFVSLAVHELRSPISLLRGYIEVFEDELAPSLDEDQKQFMQKMSVSAALLSTFVNNILNVARIENDQLKVHLHEDSLYEAVQSSNEDFTLRATVRGKKLTYDMQEGVPTIGIDRVAVYEVLSNLIDNAIKYSKESGEVIVTVKPNQEGGGTVTVQDFGVGIPASSMENLFERFYRSHHSRDQVSGTGLGLFLSKRLVEAHGGTIWVESKEGEGSTFGFDLPSYATMKEKHADENPNVELKDDQIVRSAHGWIKNHGKVRK